MNKMAHNESWYIKEAYNREELNSLSPEIFETFKRANERDVFDFKKRVKLGYAETIVQFFCTFGYTSNLLHLTDDLEQIDELMEWVDRVLYYDLDESVKTKLDNPSSVLQEYSNILQKITKVVNNSLISLMYLTRSDIEEISGFSFEGYDPLITFAAFLLLHRENGQPSQMEFQARRAARRNNVRGTREYTYAELPPVEYPGVRRFPTTRKIDKTIFVSPWFHR